MGIFQGTMAAALESFDGERERDALSQGVTSVYVGGVGRGNALGTGVFFKLRPGVGDDRVVQKDRFVHFLMGRADSSATEKLRAYTLLAGVVKDARRYIESWDEYQEKLEEYKKALIKLKEEIEKDPSKATAPKSEAKPSEDAKPAAPPPSDAPPEEGRRRGGRPRRPPGNAFEE